MENRKAELKPMYINWRVQDSQISVKYNVEDILNSLAVGDVYILFKPSEELTKLFETEINNAIKDKK